MAVVKRKDLDWKDYLRLLAESTSKVSEIEKVEFAGYLLRRDVEKTGSTIEVLSKICKSHPIENGDLIDRIATVLIAESPESIEDLVKEIKFYVLNYYDSEMADLIKEEEYVVYQELREGRSYSRCDEYDPDVDCPVRLVKEQA